MKNICNTLFLVFCTLFSNSQTTTVTLIPSKDAAIGYHDNYNTANTNYGTAVQNAAYCIPGTQGGVNINRALIGFDLTSIPTNSVVSAYLSLFALGQSGNLNGHTGSNSSYIERITSSWGESTVTWNNQPSSTSNNSVTLAQSSSSTQDYLNIDVTNLVVDMINDPTNSDGFLLRLVNEVTTNALLFCSKDYIDSTKFPKLVVTYGCETNLKLYPSMDAAIGYHDNYNTANNNYGSATQNAAYCIPGTQGGLNMNRALIDFDLSSITNAANILSARINFYALGPSGSLSGHTGTSDSAYLQRVTSSWSDSTVTWNNQPTITTQNQVTLPASSFPTQDYLNLEVTNLIKDMVNNPSMSQGFLLRLVNETVTNALLFNSKDCGDSAKFPMLEIFFNCDIAEAVSENNKQEIEFSVFPNPGREFINIKFADNISMYKSASIKLYNIMGMEVLEKKMTGTTSLRITTSNLDQGCYLLMLNIDGRISNKRIIIAD